MTALPAHTPRESRGELPDTRPLRVDTLSVPLSGARLEDNESQALAAECQSAPTILMVDDDAPLRMLFERYLTTLGYRPLFASNGEEALCVARATPAIRLIILDLMMPGLSGPQLAKELVALLPGALFLWCSGYPANALVNLGIDIKGGRFMQKPCRPLELKQRLSEMLAAR